jgi:flagellar protein FlgJ
MPSPVAPIPIPIPAGTPAAPPREAAMRRAAQDLEAVLIGQLLRAMPFSFAGGSGGPFADLLVDEYGKLIAKAGGIGVADAVVAQLRRQDGGAR